MLKVFDFYFYQYLFRKVDNPRWSSSNLFIDWIRRLKCRYNGHPNGAIFYNPCGYEPDGRCVDCGDEIG